MSCCCFSLTNSDVVIVYLDIGRSSPQTPMSMSVYVKHITNIEFTISSPNIITQKRDWTKAGVLKQDY